VSETFLQRLHRFRRLRALNYSDFVAFSVNFSGADQGKTQCAGGCLGLVRSSDLG
jgi:hypothetical protein